MLGVRYHMHLQKSYSTLGRTITFITLVLSSASVSVLLKSNDVLSISSWLMAFVAVLQALELVVDTKGKAALHASLRQKYLSLESSLPTSATITEDEEPGYKRGLSRIEEDEPPVIKSLLDKCHNELCIVQRTEEEKCKIQWYKLIAPWWMRELFI